MFVIAIEAVKSFRDQSISVLLCADCIYIHDGLADRLEWRSYCWLGLTDL